MNVACQLLYIIYFPLPMATPRVICYMVQTLFVLFNSEYKKCQNKDKKKILILIVDSYAIE